MSTLRVVVVRTGGFANVRRTAEVDDPDEAQRLSEAVRRSADRTPPGRARDAFTYEVRVVTATGTRTYELSEGQLEPDLRPRLRDLLR